MIYMSTVHMFIIKDGIIFFSFLKMIYFLKKLNNEKKVESCACKITKCS